MFKNWFKKINPMSIHSDDIKVVEIISTVINHPNTFVYNRLTGSELVLKNSNQEVNILIKENQKLVEVNSSGNCITYNIKYPALNKIQGIIKDHNKNNFDDVLNKMKINKDKLTDKILMELKEI